VLLHFIQALKTSYTNKLIVCCLNNTELSEQSVIVRVYGEKTDLFISHREEIRNIAVLHAAGCFKAPIYCKFQNGYVYGYLPGFMLSCHLVFQPHIERYIFQINFLIIIVICIFHNVDNILSNNVFGTDGLFC